MPEIRQSEDARNAAEAASGIASTVLQQAETWSRAQCELLSGIGAIWTRLLQWEREAIDASTRSLAQISECRDLGNILEVQQQWFEGAVRRTTSNWSELANDSATLIWRVTRADRIADQPQSSIQSSTGTARRQSVQHEAPQRREAAK